ncbi:MAG TPA: nitrate ABC transporter, permease protein [Nitrospiraceae bacterium]|nr:MAG: nitrate ABC transporter, permease protein [Nitrospirae bacterium GWA2_46_11]OGW22748.1 MAG: nitrate ABC transporter, permease protein [Nitrospirae bacterium GWB2_47_37]HAK89760.1 nitrate ABC transporter, permease protein [Nitrospiraceae bacterium]HCZ11287.1 nitrate ABC transporter, permease protein [Nitrospiraceae bacterium]
MAALVKQKNSLLLSMVILAVFLMLWHLLTIGGTGQGLPGPVPVLKTAMEFIRHPFYDNGPNDKGIGILTLYSMGRLVFGFGSGVVVAIIFGVVLGLNRTIFRAVNPYIQILKSISPIAWMPLLLYSVKNSGITALLVVFMASLWPTLANTSFGVANIKKDYMHVSSILQLNWFSRLFKVVLPAAGPTIIAGMRISMGSAWVAIVPAEALLGSLGLGYFVWNEWNNLSLTSVIFAIILIGIVGVIIDFGLNKIAERIAFVD